MGKPVPVTEPVPWGSTLGIMAEIKRCEEAGAYTGALCLCFVCIDTMAFLAMPEDKNEQTRDDFISWVNQYLVGHADQPY